jgi:hypothetical protein
MKLVIVKWHFHFTEQLIAEFIKILFDLINDRYIINYYILDKLTLSSIDKLDRDHREIIQKNLIRHTISKDVDKGIAMIKETEYWDLIRDVYERYPTSDIVYKICSMILSIPDMDDSDDYDIDSNNSNRIISEFLYDAQENITSTIEDLFRKYNKHHLLLPFLDPWPLCYDNHSSDSDSDDPPKKPKPKKVDSAKSKNDNSDKED